MSNPAKTWKAATARLIIRFGGARSEIRATEIELAAGLSGLASIVAARIRELIPEGEAVHRRVQGSTGPYMVTLWSHGAICLDAHGESCKGTGHKRRPHPCKHQLAALEQLADERPGFQLCLDDDRDVFASFNGENERDRAVA